MTNRGLSVSYKAKRMKRGYADGGAPNDMSDLPTPFASNFDVATKELNLTPQEQYLYQHHINNLTGSGKVTNPDGSISTIYQANVEGPGGRNYNIPTVWDGRILPVQQAVQRATQSPGGWNKWPSYATEEQAESRYNAMHDYMGEDTGHYIQSVQKPQ